MSSSPPEFSVRAARPEDAEAAQAVITALDEHYGVDTGLTVDDLRDLWRTQDLQRDAWLWELDGDAAAHASLRVRGGRFEGSGFVHPSFFGRGLGTAILATLEARARALGSRKLGSAALAVDEAAARLLESHGYRDVRHFYRMTIDMDEPPPAPPWPEGLEPRPF
jgi:GNAT superfamily N-acetyltransferase